MSHKFSPGTGCFYPNVIAYDALPDDAVPVTPKQFAAAMERGENDTLVVKDGKFTIKRGKPPAAL